MPYASQSARQDLLDTVADAVESLSLAVAALGAAYDALDEQSGDRLEAALFRPLQAAYGRAQRTHSAFAARHGLEGRTFSPASAGLPSQGVPGFLERATEAVQDADLALAELQDSMLPVEVGDPELRAGLADVRATIADLPERARHFMSRFGR
jgi:hypothetical protein